MLEKLKIRIEKWLQHQIDLFLGQTIQNFITHPESVDIFLPIIDRVVSRYMQNLTKGEGPSGQIGEIPIEVGLAKMLPKKWSWAAPFIRPYIERFITPGSNPSAPQSGVSSASGKNPFE